MRIFLVGHKPPDLDTIASAVEYTEFLNKLKRYEDAELIPTRPGEPNKETKFLFEKFEVEIPKPLDDFEVRESDAFILVDHNEKSQRHEKVVNEQIVEVIDHHKAKVEFGTPVRIDIKPLGSTSTLIYNHFEMHNIKPSNEVLGLILASILSDTQGLISSTTTKLDSKYANQIAMNLRLNIDELTFEIFEKKSDITGLSPEEIATRDYKVFDFDGTKVFINQVETVRPEKILELKQELIEAMQILKTKFEAEQTYLVVTDILKANSQIIYTTDEERAVVEKVFETEGIDNVADIGKRMSRKKDIAPAIKNALK